MPAVIPKKVGSAISNRYWGHALIFIQKLQNIPPPKRTFFNMTWEPTICVMFLPYKVHPRDIALLKNLRRCFNRRDSFWVFKSRTPKPPSSFGLVTIGQAALALIMLFSSDPLHKQCFLDLSTCSLTVKWRWKVLIKKVGREVKTKLVIWSLPAWERKREVLTSLLSHLVTRGKKIIHFWFSET